MDIRALVQRIVWVAMPILVAACTIQTAPSRTVERPTSTPTPKSYEDKSISELQMVKPVGSFVRVKGTWGGPAMDLTPQEGMFLATIEGENQFIAIRVSKSLSGKLVRLTIGETQVTVEGELREMPGAPSVIEILVHRVVD